MSWSYLGQIRNCCGCIYQFRYMLDIDGLRVTFPNCMFKKAPRVGQFVYAKPGKIKIKNKREKQYGNKIHDS